MDSQATWERVIDVLEHEMGLQERLRSLGERKRRAIVQMKLEELKEITMEEEMLVERTRGAADKRRALLRGLPGSREERAERSLGERLEEVPLESRERVRRLRQGLLASLQELSRVNRLNAELVEASVRHLNRFAKLLMGDGVRSATYAPPGRSARGRAVGVLDHRA
jgi:flagellar biosynthesis/type III secretory pathway chaperone